MSFRGRQVQRWLKEKRAFEPTIRQSVAKWCELDRKVAPIRELQAQRDRLYNIPPEVPMAPRPPRFNLVTGARIRASATRPAHTRKSSLLFPDADLIEIGTEALRLGRTKSWVIQTAWLLAREHLKVFRSDNRTA